jgi:predicted RNase H-like nuclease
MDHAGADDHGLAVALRRRTAALVEEWDSLVCAYLAATSSREEAEADVGPDPAVLSPI